MKTDESNHEAVRHQYNTCEIYHDVSVSNPMGKLYNGTTVLELVNGSSDSIITISVFYPGPFILELCSISSDTIVLETVGILASALHGLIASHVIYQFHIIVCRSWKWKGWTGW